MKALLVLLLPLVVVVADTFKETQNFQYSRTGEGNEEKKGFYGSQSGNMGGNFEVSHNMDTLAQRQMKGLAMTVGSQLGIDPHAIGTGAAVNDLGTGSVYGSASTRGSAFGVQGLDSLGVGGVGGANRFGAESRHSAGQAYGSNSNFGSRTLGQRVAGISYEEQARLDAAAGLSSQSGYRTTAGRQGAVRAVGSQYSSGSRYQTNANDYQTHHGETGDVSGAKEGTTYYVPVTGVRQVGLDSVAAGSQYAESGSRYHSGSTAYEQSQTVSEADTQRATGGTVVRPVVVRPGSAIRLSVRPGQTVPLTIPITVTPGAKPVYVQHNSGYGASGAHTQHAESQVFTDEDQQRRDFGSDFVERAGSNVGWAGVANKDFRQSSSSLESHQEKVGSTGSSGARYTPSLTVGPVADVGAIARNRGKLMVGGLEVGGDAQGSTTYNSGSRVASTGRQYGGSQSYGESQQRRYQAEAARQASEDTYDAGTNVHDSEGLGSQVYQVQTKPKSYHSSYSYEKSWEKQGTPYTIKPAGYLDQESGALTSQDLYGQNGAAQTQDISQMEEHGSRFGASSQRAASSHSAGSQYGSSYNAGRAASGAASRTSSAGASGASSARLDELSLEMQQRLREQMGKVCTDCGTGNGNTKGYSAHYSYSAQRSYGGAEGVQTPDRDHAADQHRYKREAYDGRYGSNGYHDKYYKPEFEYVEQPDFNQQAEDCDDDSVSQSDNVGKKLTELAQKLKAIMDRIDRRIQHQPEDMDQQPHGYSEIYHEVSPKSEVESMMYQREDLGQQTEDLGQHSHSFSENSNFYIPITRESKLQVGNMGYHDEYLGRPTEDLGQETQDFSQGGSFLFSQMPSLYVGSDTHLGQETEDLGSQKQGFSQDSHVFSHSSSNLNLGSTKMHQEEPDNLGQETQDYSGPQFQGNMHQNEYLEQEMEGNMKQQIQSSSQNMYTQSASTNFNFGNQSPKLHVESMINQDDQLGQETEDFGQISQGFSDSYNFYSPSHQYPKLQVGSTVHQDEHLGQESENLGEITQGFSESHSFDSPSSRNPKLQVGSMVHQDEQLGQETEDLGQITQEFSESHHFYSPSSRNPKLQVGSMVHQEVRQETEDLGQITQGFSELHSFNSPSSRNPKLQVGSMVHQDQHLGQKTEDLAPEVSKRDKESRDKLQSNIEYDDNKYVELQLGSILQQNEFFGRQPGELQQKETNKPSDIDMSQTSKNNDLPIELDTEDLKKPKSDLAPQSHQIRGEIYSDHKPTTDKNRYIQNTFFSDKNKLQDKVPGKTDVYKEHQTDQTHEAIDSHLAEILAALSKPSSDNHFTESKINDIQAKYTEVQGNSITNKQDSWAIYKEKPTVDIEFDGISESSPGQQQQYFGWDQQQQEEQKTDKDQDLYQGHVQPKPLISHSLLATNQEVQGPTTEQEERSFLDAFPEHINKNTEKEEPRIFGFKPKFTVDVHATLQTSSETEDIGQELEDGGQQTLETQWGPETFQQATVGESDQNQQQSYQPVYDNQNTHNLLTLSANKDKNAEDLHQEHERVELDNLQVSEKEKVSDTDIKIESAPATTEKPGFWNKVGSGLGKAKDKAKSWFG